MQYFTHQHLDMTSACTQCNKSFKICLFYNINISMLISGVNLIMLGMFSQWFGIIFISAKVNVMNTGGV